MLSRYFEPTLSPFSLWLGSPEDQSFRPTVDIHEDGGGIHIIMDLAGVKPEDIKIDIERGILTISGERKLDRKGFHKIERFSGRFVRSFQLPDDVDADKIEAHHENGVVTISLPRSESDRKRKIEVKALSN